MWAETGAFGEGFKITALPAARAGPTLCAARFTGPLNGVIATTTPTGNRRTSPIFPAPMAEPSIGMCSPWIRIASSAHRRRVSAARSTSTWQSRSALPVSRAMTRPMAGARLAVSSAARLSSAARS